MTRQILSPPKVPERPPTRYIKDPELPDWLFWALAICFMAIVFMPVIKRFI